MFWHPKGGVFVGVGGKLEGHQVAMRLPIPMWHLHGLMGGNSPVLKPDSLRVCLFPGVMEVNKFCFVGVERYVRASLFEGVLCFLLQYLGRMAISGVWVVELETGTEVQHG